MTPHGRVELWLRTASRSGVFRDLPAGIARGQGWTEGQLLLSLCLLNILGYECAEDLDRMEADTTSIVDPRCPSRPSRPTVDPEVARAGHRGVAGSSGAIECPISGACLTHAIRSRCCARPGSRAASGNCPDPCQFGQEAVLSGIATAERCLASGRIATRSSSEPHCSRQGGRGDQNQGKWWQETGPAPRPNALIADPGKIPITAGRAESLYPLR